MTEYRFERWKGKKAKTRGSMTGSRFHVTFGWSQMYVSAGLMAAEGTKDGRFDLLVDRKNRVFALRFSEKGEMKLPSVPGQVSVGSFVSELEPARRTRLRMLKDEVSGMWVGHLDGDEVDLSQMEGVSREG